MKTILKFVAGFGLAVLLVIGIGSRLKFGQLPDPNDPGDMGKLGPAEVRRNLRWASTSLEEHRRRNEISSKQESQMLRALADKLLPVLDKGQLSDVTAWEYGTIFVTARKWDEAIPYYERAIAHPPDKNRRINDTLQLARCYAWSGQVSKAIETSRTVFHELPIDSAPILNAVLFEIVPGGQGKGKDIELAALLKDAVGQSMRTLVDDRLPGGRSFLEARPHIIRLAYQKLAQLYQAGGKPEVASQLNAEFQGLMEKLKTIDSVIPEAKTGRVSL